MQEFLRHKEAEAAQKKQEVSSRHEEMAGLREIIEREDAELDSDIAKHKELLHKIKSQVEQSISPDSGLLKLLLEHVLILYCRYNLFER